jgi:hypothetical protein
MSNTVVMRGSDLPLREPEAVCEACGARGTVARAIRTDASGAAVETHRFCARCWPENAARLRARWDEESRVATDAWMRAPQTAQLAAEMVASAPEREGPMPFEIEAFIQMHSNADRER